MVRLLLFLSYSICFWLSKQAFLEEEEALFLFIYFLSLIFNSIVIFHMIECYSYYALDHMKCMHAFIFKYKSQIFFLFFFLFKMFMKREKTISNVF